MYNLIKINVLAALCLLSFNSVAEQAADPAAAEIRDRGYFFGYSFGNMLRQGGNEDVNLETLLDGIRDSIAGNPPALSQEQQDVVVGSIRARQAAIKQQNEDAASQISNINMQRAQAFLAANGQREGVVTTSSGLQHEEITAGNGAFPIPENTVVVHYTGRFLTEGGQVDESENGIFDSSVARGQPAEFGLGQVIPGWTEGLQLMKPGGKSRFYIPPGLAYGPGGTRGIPPNSLLIFDVELLEIKP